MPTALSTRPCNRLRAPNATAICQKIPRSGRSPTPKRLSVSAPARRKPAPRHSLRAASSPTSERGDGGAARRPTQRPARRTRGPRPFWRREQTGSRCVEHASAAGTDASPAVALRAVDGLGAAARPHRARDRRELRVDGPRSAGALRGGAVGNRGATALPRAEPAGCAHEHDPAPAVRRRRRRRVRRPPIFKIATRASRSTSRSSTGATSTSSSRSPIRSLLARSLDAEVAHSAARDLQAPSVRSGSSSISAASNAPQDAPPRVDQALHRLELRCRVGPTRRGRSTSTARRRRR